MSIQIGSDLSIPFSHSAMSIQISTPEKVLDDDSEEYQFDLPSSSDEESSDLTKASVENVARSTDNCQQFYTISDWNDKLLLYSWLVYSNNNLGCKVCRKVKTLNTKTSSGILFIFIFS